MPRPEVFLSHSNADKEAVRGIAVQLQQRGIPTWLDEWNIIPGDHSVDAMGKALQECAGCIVFLGPGGEGPWHHEELRVALDLAARNPSYRVVPVLLPGAQRERIREVLPFLASRVWVEFPKGLDDTYALHRLACGIQRREPGRSADPEPSRRRNPYRGLRVFEIADAPLFFGREVLTEKLLSKLGRLEPSAPRFLSIVGPSGSGKSSLARAGLLASLRDGALPGSAEWPQVIVRPGPDPVDSLATALVGGIAPSLDPKEIIRRLRNGADALHLQAKVALQDRRERRLVLLVDQTEEAFTLCTKDDDRAPFLSNLIHAATVRGGQTVVVLSFRADFYPRFAQDQELAALVSDNQLLVGPMSEAELRQTITAPAQRSGRPVSDALLDELINDLKDRGASLPLLEHALFRLWELPRPELDIEGYHSIGKLAGALNSRAEKVFESLTAPQQASCRRLFLRLVQPGEDALDTRQRVAGSELPADQREVSQAFAAEGVHLLTWSREGDRELLEVAHEELFRRWERLQEWVKADRSGQRIHRRLTAAAAEWHGRAADVRGDFLYRGAVLAEVQEWLARLPDDERSNLLNSQEAAFLDESRAAEKRRARDARASEQNQQLALSLELTAKAEKLIETDPQLSLLLIKEAASRANTPQVHDALVTYMRAPGRAVLRHSGPVTSAAFSPNGRYVVTASGDSTARIWDASSGKQRAELLGHSGPVVNAAFSPDGLRVVTASSDKTARIWGASSGKQRAELLGHSGPVRSAAFSPDGLRVVTASSDKTARIWDASSGEQLAELCGHFTEVVSAAFSPNGRYVVTASGDFTARIWDASSGRQLAEFLGHSNPVTSAAFSPDGRYVVTASDDSTARIWDASSGEQRAELLGHSGPVRSAAFSPDGLRVVTASSDKTARIWDASSGEHLAELRGHSKEVVSAAFSPDGLRVVTASYDFTARIWNASFGNQVAELRGHPSIVASAAFSPDGLRAITASWDIGIWDASSGKQLAVLRGPSRLIVTAAFSPDGLRIVAISEDSTARIWDASSGKLLAELRGHFGPFLGAAFSSDGFRIVTASEGSTAHIWDASSGKQLAELRGHSGPVMGAAFSPDGLRVVTSSEDSTARIWDACSGKQLADLCGHSAPVVRAAFSPDGFRVVTTALDATVRIWEASSKKQLAVLMGHSEVVENVAFSPDGLRVVTASWDKTTRIWDAASGKQLAELRGHSDQVTCAAFSPDGLRVITASWDKTAFIWDVSECVVEQVLQRDPGRDFTPTERREYLHEETAEAEGSQ